MPPVLHLLKKLPLSTLMAAVTLAVFCGVGASTVALVYWQEQKSVATNAEAKARILLDHNLAIHTYFSHSLKPSVMAALGSKHDPNYFDPAWMSSTYAVREIFNHFKQLNNASYYYKEGAIGARSPENEADADETEYLKSLNASQAPEFKSEIKDWRGSRHYVVIRKGEIMEQSCLRCHTEPGNAPRDLVGLYGDRRSFGRKAGDIVSAISVRIPIEEQNTAALETTIRVSILLLLGLGAVLGFQFWVHKILILNPIQKLKDMAGRISSDSTELGNQLELDAAQELVELSSSFNQMTGKLRRERDLQLAVHSGKIASLGTLAAGLAHEINNPLTIVRGNIWKLRDRLQKSGADCFAELEILERQEKATERISEIMSRLIDTVEPRKTQSERVELQAVVRMAIETHQVELETKGIVVECKLAPGLYAQGNFSRLQETLGYLIENAEESFDREASSKVIAIETRQQGDRVLVLVRDNGRGIPESELARIFEPFYSTKEPGAGMGMGLFMSHGMVASMEGTISVESVLNNGSCFTISLQRG